MESWARVGLHVVRGDPTPCYDTTRRMPAAGDHGAHLKEPGATIVLSSKGGDGHGEFNLLLPMAELIPMQVLIVVRKIPQHEGCVLMISGRTMLGGHLLSLGCLSPDLV